MEGEKEIEAYLNASENARYRNSAKDEGIPNRILFIFCTRTIINSRLYYAKLSHFKPGRVKSAREVERS